MAALSLSQSMTALAVSEADVEAVGKETAAGNVFIWFLCAIAFLKISCPAWASTWDIPAAT